MELKFGHALLVVGIVLFFMGAISQALYSMSIDKNSGVLELFYSGFTTALFSIFSGVLLGVGLALFADGLALRVHAACNRHYCLGALTIASLLLAIGSLSAGGEPHIIFLVAFFAFFASFITFLFSLTVMLLSEFFARDKG